MTSPRLRRITLLMLLSTSAHAALDSAGEHQLQSLQAQPELAGELIYRGTTYAQTEPAGEPLFRYERRVQTQPDGLTATHLTRTPQGRLVIAESARATRDYRLQHFAAQNRQADFSGEVEVSADGRELRYRLQEQGETREARESVDAPAVTGPTLHGFILSHWAALQTGKTLPIRFVVLQEMQTYGFTVSLKERSAGQSNFQITPSHWLIRWFIAPLEVVFDDQRRTVVSYRGRVPPQQEIDGQLHDLDAQVRYEPVSLTYR